MSKLGHVLQVAASLLLFGIIVLWMIGYFLDRPTVYRSWSTQEVTRIESALGDSISVDSIPKKFRLVWVK